MAEVDDDRLLDALAAALRPHASLEPRPAELAAFRSLVSTSGGATGTSRARRLRRWAAGLLAGGVVLSGGTAYATSVAAPRPVRSAAFALRLPVEAPELTDAKEALDDLEAELREGRSGQVAAAVADVEKELADLTPTDRRELEPRASSLVATALAFLADAADVGGSDDATGAGRESDHSGSDDSGGSDDSDSSGSDAGRGSTDADDAADDDRSGRDGGGGGGSSGSGSDGNGSEPDEPDDEPDSSDGGSSGSGSSGSGSGSDDDAGGVSASGAEHDDPDALDDLDD